MWKACVLNAQVEEISLLQLVAEIFLEYSNFGRQVCLLRL